MDRLHGGSWTDTSMPKPSAVIRINQGQGGVGAEERRHALHALHARPGCTHLYQLVSVIIVCKDASTRQKWKKE